MLDDIATLTGGRSITEDLGIKLGMCSGDLGQAKRITIDKTTPPLSKASKGPTIERPGEEIRGQIDNDTRRLRREKLLGAVPKLVSWRSRD